MGRVLVVDDEEDVRTLIRTNLLVKGHEVIEATDGTSALEEVEKTTPDLVILDVMMPGMDGFEVLEKLRTRPETENIPVVMLTAKSSEEDRVKGLVSGAHDYIAKPFYTTELLLRIDRVLNTKATADSLRQISITDSVTGVHNRRYYELRLEQLCEKARSGEHDLIGYVVDIQGIQDVARRKGWAPVDNVLARTGSWLRGSLSDGEEAFWLGSQFVVLDPTIASSKAAKKRLESVKRNVTEVLNENRREVQFTPYFGFAFYKPPQSADEFGNAVLQSPYRSSTTVSTLEEARKSLDQSVDSAFGGKLKGGLAPVPPPTFGTGSRKSSGKVTGDPEKPKKKVSKGELAKELREVTKAKTPRPTETSTTAPTPIPLGSPSELLEYVTAETKAAAAEPHDLAVYTIDIQGIDEAVADNGKDAVDKGLGPVTLQVAAMATEDEKAFWTGRQLTIVVRSVEVPTARARIDELRQAYIDGLAPLRSKMRLTPASGYAYFDFDETPQELIKRSEESPFRGAVPLTPLQARTRSASMEIPTPPEPAPTEPAPTEPAPTDSDRNTQPTPAVDPPAGDS